MTHLSIRPALTAAAALGLALSWSAGAQTGDPAPAEATVDAAALYNTGAAVIENSREVELAAGAPFDLTITAIDRRKCCSHLNFKKKLSHSLHLFAFPQHSRGTEVKISNSDAK